MKTHVDSLHDVGHAVADSQLVLNLLRGLNSRYTNMADDIANTELLPSFARVHNMLVLKELRLANDIKNAQTTALLATGGMGHGYSGGCTPAFAFSAVGG